MIYRLNQQRRQGTTAVECAMILPVVLILLFGLLIGGLGIFRYQEVAALAREAARYASVHGAQYQSETGYTAATAQDIYNNAIAPNMVGLDPSKLSYSVSWNTDNHPYHTVTNSSGQVVAVTNTVTVTISYQWIPEAYLGGVTLTSTSVMPMSY
jgi:Flp pilus assembly protein TadG